MKYSIVITIFDLTMELFVYLLVVILNNNTNLVILVIVLKRVHATILYNCLMHANDITSRIVVAGVHLFR